MTVTSTDLLLFALPALVCIGGLMLTVRAALFHWKAGGGRWFW